MLHPTYFAGAVAVGIFLISLGVTIVLALRIRRLRAEKDSAVALAQEQQEQFARDLHDLVGHWLWLASIKSELAYRHAADDARLRGDLDEILQAVRHATHAVRNVSQAYLQLSLPGETTRAKTLLSSFGAYCSVRMDVADLPKDVSATLGTVVREGRHEHAAAQQGHEMRHRADRAQRPATADRRQ